MYQLGDFLGFLYELQYNVLKSDILFNYIVVHLVVRHFIELIRC